MIRSKISNIPMASFLLAIVFSMPLSAQDSEDGPDTTAMANLVYQVQELQDEVRALTGKLEANEQELENLKRRQRDQYLDLDQRIADMRNNQPVSGLNQAPAGGVVQSESRAPARQDVPEVRDPMTTQSKVQPIAQPSARSQTTPSTAEAEKNAYDQAFQALKELRYADAAEDFRGFLDRYPNSEYSDNAQYWLGESYYVTRNYDIALTAFQDLMSEFPDSPKVPDALLKIGYTHYELKDWDRARAALTQVKENYPETTLSRLAESRLRSMRMEGHY
jgi:tol-pal system protein YbgF